MTESKTAHFARLARAAAQPLAEAEMRIALVTGQMWLDASPLSEAQRAFLEEAAAPGMEAASNGFPFDPYDTGAFRPRPLLDASLANARQYLWARTDQRYARLAASVLQRLFGSTRHVLVLVAVSCGLAIIAAAWRFLRIPYGLTVRLLAFGPAGPSPRGLEVKSVCGTRDLWSGALYDGPRATLITCDHMEYWSSREARGIAAAFARAAVANSISDSDLRS
jgi:hypothetical protein